MKDKWDTNKIISTPVYQCYLLLFERYIIYRQKIRVNLQSEIMGNSSAMILYENYCFPMYDKSQMTFEFQMTLFNAFMYTYYSLSFRTLVL